MLPLTSVPIPGTNRAISRTMLMSKNSQSIFSNKEDGIDIKIVNTKIPVPMNKACLVAK